uniref:Uncharacterized protein n=1 Tax=Rhizophora mucronata TaxID=61149 RepID=A0A2P2QAU7_RHIMU
MLQEKRYYKPYTLLVWILETSQTRKKRKRKGIIIFMV